MTSLEIIMVYRNRDLHRLKRGMQSLASQQDRDFSLLFLDYGSSADFSQAVRKLCMQFPFCKYHYIESGGQAWNRASAINFGIGISQSDYIFIADADLYFLPDFIVRIKKLSRPGLAHFFPVGYLDKAGTAALNDFSKIPPYKKSGKDALGMLLCARKDLVAINGYNSFYCLWGLEDNDMRRRAEHVLTTVDVQDVLILHQYHARVNESGELPEGWIQLMKDYYREDRRHFNGIAEQDQQHSGLAGKFAMDNRHAAEKIAGRALYIRYTLIRKLIEMKSQETKLFTIEATPPSNTSNLLKVKSAINWLLRKLSVPLGVVSQFEEQYITEKQIRDEVLFVVQTFKDEILDYCYSEIPGGYIVSFIKK